LTVRRAIVALVLVALPAAAVGCSDDGDAGAGAGLRFEPIELPRPSGSTVRVAALAHGEGSWWAAGSTIDGDGARHPALWRSADVRTWTAVATAPVSFYGEKAELYSVAAGPAGVVAVGSASGGAHGNPRTASWVLEGDRLREVAAPFEQYGGPRAISVRAVAAGPDGFVIIGTRRAANERSGGVAWVSPDGQAFTLVDDDPALQSGPDELAHPLSVAGTADGFVAAGDVRYRGRGTLDADGIVWTSPDGRGWTRAAVGADGLGVDGSVSVTAVADSASGPVGAGVATDDEGAEVIVWRAELEGHWAALRLPGWGADPVVTAMAADGESLVVAGRRGDRGVTAVSDGEGWRLAALPDDAPAGPHVDVDVAVADGVAVVAAADEAQAAIWRSTLTSD